MPRKKIRAVGRKEGLLVGGKGKITFAEKVLFLSVLRIWFQTKAYGEGGLPKA